MFAGRSLFVGGVLGGLSCWAMAQETPVTGVTFWNTKGEVFLPLRTLSNSMSLGLSYDAKTKISRLADVVIDPKATRPLFDGATLVSMNFLVKQGFEVVTYPEDPSTFTLVYQGAMTQVTLGQKWVEVNLRTQELRAWQGEQLVMVTRISSGKPGHSTPTGSFKTGPHRTTMHYSSIYDNAPMPFSVQINGDIFIHGGVVPGYPASHGCVRMPRGGRDAARYFYNWVDNGVPVAVTYAWSDRAQALIAREKPAEGMVADAPRARARRGR